MTQLNNDHSESLLVHFRRQQGLKDAALAYPSLILNERQLCDLELLLNRAYYPLTGFLGQNDYNSVLDRMRLVDGTLWPMPVCLDIDEKTASTLTPGNRLALNDPEGFLLAVLTISDIWQTDPIREAEAIFGTAVADHPGAARFLRGHKPWSIGGQVEGLHLPIHYDFRELRFSPAETSRFFSESGWRQVIGVYTSGIMHCKDREEILAGAREAGSAILLQPAVGFIQAGDKESYTLVRCLKKLTGSFPKNMIHLGLLPSTPIGAGPREALFQAMIKRNYGCTHFLVEDNHADPLTPEKNGGTYYPLHAAQELVTNHEQETGIIMVPRRRMAYSVTKAQYVPLAEAGEADPAHLITHAELRRRLEMSLAIPEWFTYPEIVEELRYAYPSRSRQGFTIFISGLSGAGKSTLARVLLVKLMEMRDRPVTLLDGDIVRRNLSSELNFSKEHRDLNIIRIGFVAHQITKNGGIALCAPIAPYPESRQVNRELISRDGGFIEVYMETPIEVCEQRDRKGLYAKARAGKISGVTGVSDPYIPPKNPEIVIDTTNITPVEAAQEVLLYLEEQGYIK